MMERKTRYEVQELLVAEYETDGKFITDRTNVTKSKERYVPRMEFDEALQEAFFTKVSY